jgi:hypothetical protein
MSDIEFEKGIPIPRAKNKAPTQFSRMEVGDSFVGGVNEAAALQRHCERHGWKYCRRMLEGEPRMWRLWRIE